MACARLLLDGPQVAFLDEASSALDTQREESLYGLIRDTTRCYVSVGHRPTLVQYHTHVLELGVTGSWKYLTATEYKQKTS